MRPTPKNFEVFESYVKSNSALYFLLKRYFVDIDRLTRIDVIIQTLGFHEIRNRLASVFIYYEKEGDFPKEVPPDYTREINNLALKIREYTIEGHSRDFMLGFYLSIVNAQAENKIDGSFSKLMITDECLKLLEYSKSKIKKIDIVLMVLTQFISLMGVDVLDEKLKNELSYRMIYNSLDKDRKRIFMDNMLSYSYSIDESEMFVEEVIK